MQDMLYTTRWNDITRRPIMGHTWVSEDEARALYDGGEGIEIVDARIRDEQGVPRPVWVIGASFGFRVHVFTPGGSVARIGLITDEGVGQGGASVPG